MPLIWIDWSLLRSSPDDRNPCECTIVPEESLCSELFIRKPWRMIMCQNHAAVFKSVSKELMLHGEILLMRIHAQMGNL